MLALSAFALGNLLAAQAVLVGSERLAPITSGHGLASQLKPLLDPGTPVFSVKLYNQSLTYYLQRPVTLVAHSDEMAFGVKQEPDRWIPSLEQFAKRWRSSPKAFAILRPSDYSALAAQGVAMEVVGGDQHVWLVRTP